MVRHVLAALVAAVAVGLAAAPVARAEADPCQPTEAEPNPCGNVPETPVALLYPLVGAGIVLTFAGAAHLRRRAASDRG